MQAQAAHKSFHPDDPVDLPQPKLPFGGKWRYDPSRRETNPHFAHGALVGAKVAPGSKGWAECWPGAADLEDSPTALGVPLPLYPTGAAI